MLELRQYVIAVVTAAIVVAMIENLATSSQTQKVIRMVSGLFLSVILLSPLGNIRISEYASYFETVDLEARSAAAYGEEIYKDNLNTIITERCETYILDKAKQLGAKISVEVQCDTSDIPVPIYAKITGSISPYVRKTLQNMIAEDIGIPEDKQLWA